MFSQLEFGNRLKSVRRKRNLTQKEVAFSMGVSEQAVSKWENGECLPDVYNLKLIGQLFHVSVDYLLDVEGDKIEKIIEIIKVGGADFKVIEKPETILAGKIIYAKDFADMDGFNSAIESFKEKDRQETLKLLRQAILPVTDINLSVNFWLNEKTRAFGFVREVETEKQPDGVDVYIMPKSLYIKVYTDKEAAGLIAKEQCEVWELFSYIRNFFMPAHGFRMAENGAQELEVYDTPEHKTGHAYMPVIRD